MDKYLIFEILINSDYLWLNELVYLTILNKSIKLKLDKIIIKKIDQSMNMICEKNSYIFFQTNNIIHINGSLFDTKLTCSDCNVRLFDNIKILFGISKLYCKVCFKKYFITKSEILRSHKLLRPYLKKVLRWKNNRNHYIYVKHFVLKIYMFLRYKNKCKNLKKCLKI